MKSEKSLFNKAICTLILEISLLTFIHPIDYESILVTITAKVSVVLVSERYQYIKSSIPDPRPLHFTE